MGDESVAARGIPYGCATDAVLVVEQAVDGNLVDAGFPGDVDNAAIKSVIGKLMYCGAENPFLRILRPSHAGKLYQPARHLWHSSAEISQLFVGTAGLCYSRRWSRN